MRKLIFLFALISTFVFGQTPTGNRVTWADTVKISYNNQFVDLFQLMRDSVNIAMDTTELVILDAEKAYLSGYTRSTDLGAGDFIKVDSSLAEGNLAFNHPDPGSQWVRKDYYLLKKVSLIELGMDYSGSIDISAIFNNLIDDLSSGDNVYIPRGNYRVGSTINITKGLNLFGEGSFVDSTSNDTIFVIKSSNVTMTDFEIIGKPSADSVSWNTAAPAIDIKPSAGQTFSNFEFSRLKISGKRVGIKGWNVHNVLVKDNRVTNVAQGFAFGVRNASTSDSASTNIKILNNYVKHTNGNKAAARGVSTNNVRDLLIQGNTMYGTGMSIENFITSAFLDSALANEWSSDSVGYFLNAKVLDNSLCNTISGASVIQGNTIDGDSLPANCYWQVNYALEPSINALVIGNVVLNTPNDVGGVIIFNAMSIKNNLFFNMDEDQFAVFYFASPRTAISHLHAKGDKVIIEGNEIRQCKRFVFGLTNSTGPDTMMAWTIKNNIIYETVEGAYVYRLRDVEASGNVFINSNRNNTSTTLSGVGMGQIALQFILCKRVAVYDNYFKNTNHQRGAAYSIGIGNSTDSVQVFSNRTYGLWGNHASTGNNYVMNATAANNLLNFYDNYEDGVLLSRWNDIVDTLRVNQKFLMPTHTTTTRNVITTWAEGNIIYNTTVDSVQIYVNGGWKNLTY